MSPFSSGRRMVSMDDESPKRTVSVISFKEATYTGGRGAKGTKEGAEEEEVEEQEEKFFVVTGENVDEDEEAARIGEVISQGV